MGELKSSRYDSTIAEKANTPFAKRFRELVSDAKTANELKDYLGITIQAINQYKQGTAYPKTENLIKIADYFGISVDYLLGLSNTSSRKEDVQVACKTTGLSEDAIYFLEGLKNDRSERSKDKISAINTMLSEREGDECLAFWGRLAEYFFTEEKPFSALLKYGKQQFEAEEILYAFLARNNELLRKFRERLVKEKEDKNNGKH